MWSFITDLIAPVTGLISELVEDKDRANALRAEMLKMQTELSVRMMDYESQLLTARQSIVVAEAQGGSWLQRSWRPITMLTFLALVVCDSFGWLANPLESEAWTMLQIGLGGYVAGRSLEKIAPHVSLSGKR